jgi:hypothetical protein
MVAMGGSQTPVIAEADRNWAGLPSATTDAAVKDMVNTSPPAQIWSSAICRERETVNEEEEAAIYSVGITCRSVQQLFSAADVSRARVFLITSGLSAYVLKEQVSGTYVRAS